MKTYNMLTQSINKDGKKFYHQIGKIFAGEYEGKPTLSGYLNTNPNQKVYLFENQPQGQQQQQAPQQQAPSGNIQFENDNPFA
jgi:hypothetical protein